MSTDKPAAAAGDSGGSTKESEAAAVDIEQLAERVYQLMRSEVRLETARGVAAVFFGSD